MTVLVCPKCDDSNPDGYRFCGQCGWVLDDAAAVATIRRSRSANWRRAVRRRGGLHLALGTDRPEVVARMVDVPSASWVRS